MPLLRVLDLDPAPLAEVEYLFPGEGGHLEVAPLPVLRGGVEGLPPGVEGLLFTGDLQGWDGEGQPLGLALPGVLRDLAATGAIPPPSATLVFLLGDLVPGERRGEGGDARPVWEAFLGAGYLGVYGVPGNHDGFGPEGPEAFRERAGAGLLLGEVVEAHGLRLAGLGGLPGRPDRPFRMPEEAYLRALAGLLRARPHLLLLHEGPDWPQEGFPGHRGVRGLLEGHRYPLLVVRGHAPWPRALVALSPQVQVLNAEGRVLLLSPGA